MNVSPETNIEGANTEITAMAISQITNKLDKNQKSGDATKVKVSGELEIVKEQEKQRGLVQDEGEYTKE